MKIKENDISTTLQKQVQDAVNNKQPLFIHAGKSKLFYGNEVIGKPLDISKHTGVISYEPTELCITVRAGTRISELQKLLAEQQQILPFEPPIYSKNATIGGAIAAGISGPRRAYTGSIRDAILGVQMINGNAEIVNFGGQVMKNVAGYDLSRLMVRSQGILGVILSVSLRLLPKPSHDLTIRFDANQQQSLDFFQELRSKQHPITATVWFDQQAYIRLSGSTETLENSQQQIKGEILSDAKDFWREIRDQQHHFFGRTDKPLWRISLPPGSSQISRIDDNILIEWGGAQRWVNSNMPANIIQSIAKSRDGFATLFRGDLPETPHFPKLEEPLLHLYKQLKNKMDPHGIFNPGRMYENL
ncbi:MAG: glycolate oxidase subunit GlcE [Cocleimonas sp.]